MLVVPPQTGTPFTRPINGRVSTKFLMRNSDRTACFAIAVTNGFALFSSRILAASLFTGNIRMVFHPLSQFRFSFTAGPLEIPTAGLKIIFVLGILCTFFTGCPSIFQAVFRIVIKAFCLIKGAFRSCLTNSSTISYRLHNSLAIGDFGQRLLCCILNANEAIDIMSCQLSHFQIVAGAILHRNVTDPIETNNLSITGAGNTASEVDLTAAGIDIFHQNLLSGRVVVHIELILVATRFGIPERTAVDDFILFARSDSRVGQFPLSVIALVDTIDGFFGSGIRNIRIVITETTLDNPIDIDIGCIDVDIATGNIAAAGFAAIFDIRFDLIYLVCTFSFTDSILIRLVILALHIGTNIDNPVRISLRNISFCRIESNTGTTNGYGVFNAFTLDDYTVTGTLDGHVTVFGVHISLNEEIRHRLHGTGHFSYFLAFFIQYITLVVNRLSIVIAINGNLARLSVCRFYSTKGSTLFFIDSRDLLVEICRCFSCQTVPIEYELATCIIDSNAVNFRHQVGVVRNGDFRRALCF